MMHSDDTPNPNPNLERKMGDVLCIFSYHRVFILDMDLILSGEDFKEGTSLELPPMKRIFNFVESKLPLGMGIVKFGNFLYMFGGEYSGEDPFDYADRVFGFGIPEEHPPCPVFRLDLTDDLSEPVQLRPMLGPKLYAVVEEIGGKIYVLSYRCFSSSMPMFEVFNPMTEEWGALPNPLPSSYGWRIVGHCVSGSDIICKMQGSYIYCRFSTITETWEYTADLSSREKTAMSGRLDVRYEDVYLTLWGEDCELWAIMDGPEPKDGYYTEVNSYDIEPCVPPDFEIAGYTTLVDTSEQGEYMCGLVPYASNEGFAVYIFVFLVEKLESEKVPAPLSVRYLRRKVYDFTYTTSKSKKFPFFLMRKAVIGRLSYNTSTGSGEFRKRKEDEDDEDEEEEEEGQVVSTHGLPL